MDNLFLVFRLLGILVVFYIAMNRFLHWLDNRK